MAFTIGNIRKRIYGIVRHLSSLRVFRLFAKPRKPCIALPPRREWQGQQRYLCAVAIIWNEGPNLLEWLEFQRLVGMEHIYLYDDGSTDDSIEVLRPYTEEGFVTSIPWAPFFEGYAQQRLAYAHALSTFGTQWRWMAFIDLDEFLFPVRDASLAGTLERYEDLPAIVVPWHMYGFCGHETRPQGLVIENYTWRIPFPPMQGTPGVLNWKSIVNPALVAAVDSPHFFHLRNGARGGFAENREWVDKQRPQEWEKVESGVFRLNHYFTKSRSEFASRRAGGRSVSGRGMDKHFDRAIRYADAIESLPAIEDDLILRFLPPLQKALSTKSQAAARNDPNGHESCH